MVEWKPGQDQCISWWNLVSHSFFSLYSWFLCHKPSVQEVANIVALFNNYWPWRSNFYPKGHILLLIFSNFLLEPLKRHMQQPLTITRFHLTPRM